MAIDPISASLSSISTASTGTATQADSGSIGDNFGGALRDMLKSVDAAESDSNQAVGGMLDGTGDVHEAMIAMQKADTLLQLTVQVRNKIVQAYQDVMRMSV